MTDAASVLSLVERVISTMSHTRVTKVTITFEDASCCTVQIPAGMILSKSPPGDSSAVKEAIDRVLNQQLPPDRLPHIWLEGGRGHRVSQSPIGRDVVVGEGPISPEVFDPPSAGRILPVSEKW